MSSFEQDNEKLTPKQNTLILALLSRPTIAEAAQDANVPDSTARRWLRLPHVQDAYKQAQQEVFDSAMLQLKMSTLDAVKQLQKEMLSLENDASVRVRAATVLLTKGVEQSQGVQLKQVLQETLARLDKEQA